jgi:phosphoribosylaminoimidazolecarboxamide formyltransferase / IMP cyclohydrolase
VRAIRRALISVSDKRGLADFAATLVRHGCEIIATGGSAEVLTEAAIPYTEIAAITGNPEAFGGRMKTLSFAVGASLLFHRERDGDEARRLGVQPIDMVVCNLYPFEEVVADGGSHERLVENIDIGGPTMLRAAAKNHQFVAAVSAPDQYGSLASEMDEQGGRLGPETRSLLMVAAFQRSADYEAAIATKMDAVHGGGSRRFEFHSPRPLRYGENSHQSAILLRQRGAASSICDAQLLGGKELSYNNITDLQAALDAVQDLPPPACSIIKHQNPCGLAAGGSPAAILATAWAGDPLSSFGSVIAFNMPVDRPDVEFLALDGKRSKRKFVELVCAPEFTDEAVAYLSLHKSLRIVVHGLVAGGSQEEYRYLTGGLLVQSPDNQLWEHLHSPTAVQPEQIDEELLAFGTIAARQVKSNAIVIVRRTPSGTCQLLGIGAGQPNRINSTRLALERAHATLAALLPEPDIAPAMAAAYLVSDAFFPFPDNIDLCGAAGIRHIFQPGGSMRDRAVTVRCDELAIAMVMTGVRHFRH